MATDLEREMKELLSERAGDVRPRGDAPPLMLRRARRRRIGTALGSSLVVAAVVAGGIVGARTLLAPSAAPPETRLGGPADEPFAVWPQTTREEAERAQTCVDAGREECMWQLNALEVVRRYGEQELGWQQVFAFVQGFNSEYLLLPLQGEEQDIGLVDVVDPLTVRIAECLPPQIDQPTCRAAQLRVEKLLVPDVYGIWSITEAQHGVYEVAESPRPSPTSETTSGDELPQGVVGFVERFMEERHSGAGAEPFLDDRARDQFAAGEGGLSLYGYAQDGQYGGILQGGEFGVDGPPTYRVHVSIHVGELTILESLLVETRPDGDETGPAWRDFLVANAERIE